MHLSVETRESGEVIVIHCEGRIVYRDEAAALSRVVDKALEQTRAVVLDLAGVQSLDSAGLGELVLAHMAAESEGKTVKLAGASPRVQKLLELTNLSSLLGIYPSVDDAIERRGECAPRM